MKKEVHPPMKKRNGQAAARRALALTAAGATLLFSWCCAAGGPGALPTLPEVCTGLLRAQLAGWAAPAQGSPHWSALTALVVQDSALLRSNLPGGEETPARNDPPGDRETEEGTVIDPAEADTPAPAAEADNGVAAKTIHPTNPAGYLVWKDVFITNTSGHTPDLNALMQTRPAAVFTGEMPQILILHTHGTEAYTTPAQGGAPATQGRSEDTERNVVRVGDEMADVFEEAGISVLHDRTLYDAAGYSDAYDRAEKAIQAYLKKYPSIHFVLDIHRDAIEDSQGNIYKVISQVEGENLAQMSIVVGSDGGGLPHDHWQENLKLALLLQQRITERCPTLMRPMYLRASRYNGHATTGSLLVEVGAAGNSLDEAIRAGRLFAEEMAQVLQTLAPAG